MMTLQLEHFCQSVKWLPTHHDTLSRVGLESLEIQHCATRFEEEINQESLLISLESSFNSLCMKIGISCDDIVKHGGDLVYS